MSMPNTICADRQCYPWIILLCAVLCAVICDKSWKWTESFVISSSKHELCFHVFHPWSLLHFRSHQAWLALAARWPDFCFALKPVTEVWSSWLQLNALVPIFIGTSKQWNTWVPKEGHTWQHYYVCVFGISGHLIFWMGMFKVSRWNGLEILIPKHLWKSIIGPLGQI